MRRRAVIVGLLALVCGAGPVVAPAQPSAGLRTVNRRRLYTESRFAARVLAMLEARAAAIREENATVTAMLEAEELSLTQRRAESEPAAFRALASAFDTKVVQIREAQLRRQRALEDWAAAEERRFLRAAQPVLRSLMAEAGASVLLDERSVLLALPELDLTDPAIARIDAVLGDGADDAAALPEMISLIDAAAGVAPVPGIDGQDGTLDAGDMSGRPAPVGPDIPGLVQP
ncbi:MAG TPA: hypothetical protein DDY29_02030 [Rhodobacteraceae bacterium]|jgi:Skp family chaperone for outer membrane proteins|nr:OmpH family outer membrane protein [Paracoccaceae bacterium]HBG97543.1 hypothetical protein [Paracoccaceae bacterium]